MVGKRSRGAKRRFTVTLDEESYRRLKELVERHEPPLTLNYGVQFAVKLLLERAADRQTVFKFADLSGGTGKE